MKLPSIGIIGAGSFGTFLAEKLGEQLQVQLYARGESDEQFRLAATSDYVVLALPLSSYDEVLERLVPELGEQSVIVDVCSVKQQAVERIRKHLPDRAVVATHPLFGPESASESIRGHTFVMCPDVSDPVHYQQISAMAQMLGLRVIRMSAENHDRDMALVQGLTFFVAHALGKYGIDDAILSTPSFEKLRALADLDSHHSEELLDTIQKGNQHTADVRHKFLKLLHEIDDQYSR